MVYWTSLLITNQFFRKCLGRKWAHDLHDCRFHTLCRAKYIVFIRDYYSFPECTWNTKSFIPHCISMFHLLLAAWWFSSLLGVSCLCDNPTQRWWFPLSYRFFSKVSGCRYFSFLISSLPKKTKKLFWLIF